MMRKLDKRGVASLEMILVFVPLFSLMFVIFDLGRYAITQQSLNALADAGARAVMICYNVTSNSYTGCTGDPLPTDAAKQAVAPFLFSGGLTPTLNVTAGANALTVTASQSGFTMLMPIWAGKLDAPSAFTTIPF
jgi:Flp pilus assembly protein TadG